MLEKQRYKRLRSLIRKLNQARRVQANKIDILCNDLVSAQKDFIKLVGKLSFVADAYERLLGLTDLAVVMDTAARVVQSINSAANVSLFLLTQDTFRIHRFGAETAIDAAAGRLGSSFTTELVRNISNSNKICLAEDIFALGLQGNLAVLDKIHIAAVPLTQDGISLGFMLIYWPVENKFSIGEIEKVVAITPGLCRTIRSCQALSHLQEPGQASFNT